MSHTLANPGRGSATAEAREGIDPARVAETPAASSPPERTPLTGTSTGASGAPPAPTPVRAPRPRRPLILVGLAAGVALVLLAGVAYWRNNIGLVKTNNAQTNGDLAPISAQVTGRIIRVDVVQDQYVHTGAALLELDPTDYRIALAQAQAALAAAHAQVRVSQAALVAQQQQYMTGLGAARTSLQATQPSVPQAVAQLRMQEGTTAAQLVQAQQAVTTALANERATRAALATASDTLSRDRQLFAQGAIAAQQLDTDTSAYQTALSNYQAAQDSVRQMQAGVASARANRQQVAVAQQTVQTNRGQIAHAEAVLQQAAAGGALVRQYAQQQAAAEAQVAVSAQAVQTAQVNLSRTVIRAPADGWVSSTTPVGFSVVLGQVVQPNVPLLYLTLARHVWVVANIKENQVGGIRVGDPVGITVDARRGRLYHGHVESIGSATGSSTALLPPDNATGNFIKVVQLVPVRIALDPPPDAGHPLAVGLSAEVTIDTRAKAR
jgi:membrane fusion protein, multidrug efflux system